MIVSYESYIYGSTAPKVVYERNVQFEHHGIKGMKWGVRRYQDYDGHYTQAGMKRYGAAEKAYNKANSKYSSAKAAYKANKTDANKAKLKAAKTARKDAQKNLSHEYDRVKVGNDMDKNKHRNVKYAVGTAGLLAGGAIGARKTAEHVFNLAQKSTKGTEAQRVVGGAIAGAITGGAVKILATAGAATLAGIGIARGVKRAKIRNEIKSSVKDTPKAQQQRKAVTRKKIKRAAILGGSALAAAGITVGLARLGTSNAIIEGLKYAAHR